jgi:hypothetical protein
MRPVFHDFLDVLSILRNRRATNSREELEQPWLWPTLYAPPDARASILPGSLVVDHPGSQNFEAVSPPHPVGELDQAVDRLGVCVRNPVVREEVEYVHAPIIDRQHELAKVWRNVRGESIAPSVVCSLRSLACRALVYAGEGLPGGVRRTQERKRGESDSADILLLAIQPIKARQ